MIFIFSGFDLPSGTFTEPLAKTTFLAVAFGFAQERNAVLGATAVAMPLPLQYLGLGWPPFALQSIETGVM